MRAPLASPPGNLLYENTLGFVLGDFLRFVTLCGVGTTLLSIEFNLSQRYRVCPADTGAT